MHSVPAVRHDSASKLKSRASSFPVLFASHMEELPSGPAAHTPGLAEQQQEQQMEETMQMDCRQPALHIVSQQPAMAPPNADADVKRQLQEEVAKLKKRASTAEEELRQCREDLKELQEMEQLNKLIFEGQRQYIAQLQQKDKQLLQGTQNVQQHSTSITAHSASAMEMRAKLARRELLVQADRRLNRCADPRWAFTHHAPVRHIPPTVEAWFQEAIANRRSLVKLEWEDLYVVFKTTPDSLRGIGNKAAHNFTVDEQAAAVRAMAGRADGASLKRIFEFVHGRSP